jgi:hypothetical protein
MMALAYSRQGCRKTWVSVALAPLAQATRSKTQWVLKIFIAECGFVASEHELSRIPNLIALALKSRRIQR